MAAAPRIIDALAEVRHIAVNAQHFVAPPQPLALGVDQDHDGPARLLAHRAQHRTRLRQRDLDAARRMSAAEHAALRAAHEACRLAGEAQDPDAYYYKNEELHNQIYMGSHNAFLCEQARALHRRLRPCRRLQLRVRDRVSTSWHEHDAVVEAIVAGDGARTAELLRDHIAIQGERFADLMASLSRLATKAA